MSSAAKAFELLSFFSTARPEIGLSQLCRIAGRDKATTYRHLQALETAGFVEQNPATRQYRLGPAILHLAQLREHTVPRKEGALAALQDLAEATGETAHVTVLSGTTLYSLVSCESPMHGTRAIVDITTFPLHATASGLCTLAFGPESLFDQACSNLERFTESTATDRDSLQAFVDNARGSGFGQADRCFETEVQGLSTPVFDHSGQLAGTVAVASVASRFTQELKEIIKTQLVIASRQITHNWGGTIPAHIEAIWAQSLSNTNTLESAS